MESGRGQVAEEEEEERVKVAGVRWEEGEEEEEGRCAVNVSDHLTQ